MPKSLPPAPTVLPSPCPACGAELTLRSWEKRVYVACEGAGCRYGYDADPRGNPLSPCPSCDQGHLKSTPKGRVCCHCGRWDQSPRGARGPGQAPCPRCGTGTLSILKGEYGHFAGCSDPACGLTYTTDEKGRPEGGRCKACKGPVRRTRAGGRICLVCETWQTPKPLPTDSAALRPPEAPCPACGRGLRVTLTRKRRWIYRCDTCLRWIRPGHPEAPLPSK